MKGPDLISVTAARVGPLLPRRDRTAHKGDFGKVHIFGGSVGYTGAPVLAALGALAPDSRGILVHGTPWSGKTPCWRRVTLPLGGVARLRHAPENRFIPLSGIEAFVAFIPGMSVMTSDSALYSAASSTALDILAAVPAGILECLPDADAARLCFVSLIKVKGEEGER